MTSETQENRYLAELFAARRFVHYNKCCYDAISGRDESYYKTLKKPAWWIIATVSRNMKYSEGQDREGYDLVFSESDGLFRYNSHFDFRRRREDIVKEVNSIASEASKFRSELPKDAVAPLVICLGEFDYPCFLQATKVRMDRQDPFIEELQRLATQHDCLILAGSYHQVTGGRPRNTALLFEPGGGGPVRHLKWRGAQKLGEQIQHPENNEVRYYVTKHGIISVLVCMDSYDINIIASIAQRERENVPGHLDLVLVPSFNASGKANRFALDACERLAYLAATTVVYVNSAAYDDYSVEFPKHLIMCAGETRIKQPNEVPEAGGRGAPQVVRSVLDVGLNTVRMVALNYEYMVRQEERTKLSYPPFLKATLVGEGKGTDKGYD